MEIVLRALNIIAFLGTPINYFLIYNLVLVINDHGTTIIAYQLHIFVFLKQNFKTFFFFFEFSKK